MFFLSSPAVSIAEPVEILLSGVLATSGADDDNLDGSLIQVSYQADSTDMPYTGGGSGPFSHTSYFSFNVSIDITNRPDGHEDLHREWPDIDVRLVNNFTSSGENDEARFSRVGGGGLLPEDSLFVETWDVDFGADGIFPDRERPGTPYPPEDLSFLFALDQVFTKYVTLTPEVFTSMGGLNFYRIDNLTVTNVHGVPGIPVPLTLVSRLDGAAYYDTILDITWLADANYAETTGFDDDGFMSWEDANTWVSGLDIKGITGWRLPTLSPINGVSFNTSFSNNATTDGNYADSEGWVGPTGSPVSELGYLYYVTLGNIGWCTPDDANPISCEEQTGWDITNTGPFSNLNTSLVNGHYWTDKEIDSFTAWSFGFSGGAQIGGLKGDTFKGWVVHDGDIFLTLLRCDLNDNGEVDAGDLAQVTRMVVDNIADDLDCDINNVGNGDGVISTADLVIVSRIVLGIIPEIYN